MVIFQASPSAGPGEAVSVQGAFSAQATAWLRPAATPGASPRQLPILGQSATQLTAQLPADLPLDCYQLWVREPGGQTSAPVALNRALGLQVDADEVAPGRPLRLYGRNLSLSGYSPSVEFIDAASGASAGLATLDPSQSDAYSLLLTAPAGLQPGTSYQLRLSNGAGGRAGTSLAEVSVRARAAGVDYFGLQVGWASVFDFYATRYNVVDDMRLPQRAKADGVSNDQPALQAALNYVSQRGGGVVYLPAGTYKLVYTSTAALAIPDNVVVQGAGMDRTLLRYGYGPAPAMGYAIGLAGRQRLGLCELSLENVNEQGRWEHNLTSYPARTGQRYVFLKNVRWRYAGEALTIVQPTEQVLVQGCEFTSRYNPQSQYQQGPLTVSHARQWVLRGNRFEHQVWQTGFNKDCEQLVFEGNTFVRDASVQRLAQPPSVETRTLSINYAKNVVLRSNTFQTSNGPALPHNDGETILNESGGPSHQDADFGYVSSASSTSLTAAQARWPQLTSGAIVVIVGGKGQGQWRRVVRNSAQSLTLDQAWDVVPDASSRYSITGWSAENWLVQDNLLQNNRAGLELYQCSSWQVAIVGNHLVNSDGIWLRPGQQENRSGLKLFNVIYNTQVVKNVVENFSSEAPAYIGLLPYQNDENPTLGTCAVGIEFRGNTVRARPDYKLMTLNNELGTEGFYNHFLAQFKGTNGDTPVTLGIIFQNNTAINCANGFYLNSGAYNTLLCNNTLQSSANLLKDVRVTNAAHASVNTFSCAATDLEALRTPENPAGTVAGLRYQYYELSGSVQMPTSFDNLTALSSGSAIIPDVVAQSQRDHAYAIKYTGYVTVPNDGQYTFATSSDDGSQVYIGTSLILTNDGLHPAQEQSGTIGLKAGTHAITITYLQSGGDRSLSLSYFGPGVPKQAIPASAYSRVQNLRQPENPTNTVAGLDYQYYEIRDLGKLPAFSNLKATITGTTTSLNVMTQSQRDYGYAIKYAGYVSVPTDGQYTFYLNADDGGQLFIGSTLVVDADAGLYLGQDRSGSLELKAGTHAITIMYYQNGGGRGLTASYAGPNMSKQTIPTSAWSRIAAVGALPVVGIPIISTPALSEVLLRTPENPSGTGQGLSYQYYEARGGFNRLPAFSSLTPTSTGAALAPDVLAHSKRGYAYALRYTGYVSVPADGQYTFYTNSDDGSQLFIGSQLVVDNDGGHSLAEKAGTIGLKAGVHAITITYFQSGGDRSLTVSYAGPNLNKQPIPSAAWSQVLNTGSRLAATNLIKGAIENTTNRSTLVTSNSLPEGLHVFPNPSTGTFTVDYTATVAQSATILLLNTVGQQVYRQVTELQDGANHLTIQASGLAQGVYHLVLTTASQQRHMQRVTILP